MNEIQTKLFKANQRNVRTGGVVYRIIAHTIGGKLLAEAENTRTGERTNLLTSRSPLTMGIRNLVNLNLFV